MPAIRGCCISAGNASQFSDGASGGGGDERQGSGETGLEPSVSSAASRRRLRSAAKMGIGPVFAVPKLLEQTGKTSPTSTVGAERSLPPCGDLLPDRIGIPNERLNVNGAHRPSPSYAMSGARWSGMR